MVQGISLMIQGNVCRGFQKKSLLFSPHLHLILYYFSFQTVLRQKQAESADIQAFQDIQVQKLQEFQIWIFRHFSIHIRRTAKIKEIQDNSRKFAQEFIIDANNKAAEIIYDAERRAAEIIAFARNSAERIRVSSNNLKVSILDDISKISGEISNIKNFINIFNRNSTEMISESELFLQSVEYELKSGGISIFETPEVFDDFIHF